MSSQGDDCLPFIRSKLEQDEMCNYCVSGCIISDNFPKVPRYTALIERQGDYALFVYSSKSVPCRSGNDLRLEQVFPVNEELRLLTESPTSQGQYLLGIQVREQKYLFELPQGLHTDKFITEIKQAIAIYSQNAGFGLPPSFSWLDKHCKKISKKSPLPPRKQVYSQNAGFGLPPSFSWLDKHRKKISKKSPLPPRKQDNDPYGMDEFDPLKHMNIDNGKNKADLVQVAENSYDETPSLNIASANFKKSASKESLDLLDSYDDFSESLDKVAERTLGLKPGTHLADGLKPTGARETLVEYFLNEREKEFVDIELFRIFVGTWNVNGQNAVDLAEWLSCDKAPPDIYAIGFQELDLSNQAYIFSDSAREAEWQDVVKKSLHPSARYRKVKSIRLVGVLLIVYVKESLAGNVSLIDSDNVPTGIMGMLGNKGGVSVRMCLHSTSLCFINSHLAAHQDEFDRRNQDSKDIEMKMRFKQFRPPLTVQDHDIVFWIGDLNYRIDLDIDSVKEYVSQNMLQKLKQHDQLHTQMLTNPTYKTYTEGEINFHPTYKYDPGTDNFDTSEKSRIPAWCDRVLWKGNGVRQIIYRSHPSLRISDHKPVSGLFEAGVKVIDMDRYNKVYVETMKKIDRLENDYLPQVTLAQKEFVFTDVKFVESQEQILAIANIGQVPVTYEFINKLDEDTYCKPWLKVTPFKAVIMPGDSCEISLEIFVDKTFAYKFNRGEEHLEDILVMHLHGGKDFFIPVSGNYICSSFGSSIDALIQVHGSIQEVPVKKLHQLEQPGSLNSVDVLTSGTSLLMCPKEIWKLVDHIWQYGRHQEDLFQQPGLNTEINEIRDCLDKGEPETLPGGIHSVAEALLLFLESLAEPVIPYKLYDQCLNCCNNFLLCKQVMSSVPDSHRNVFKYLCAFLRDLLEESKFNKLEIKYLASMFGDVFLRAPPQQAQTKDNKSRRNLARSEELKKAAFLYHFLAHPYDE